MAHACHDEHKEHGGGGDDGHGHGHGHGGHDHDHGPDDPDGDSLFDCIDYPKVRALNVTRPGDAKLIFKSNKDRTDTADSVFVVSHDGDPEILLYVPFTSSVKVKSFCVGGGDGGKEPTNCRLFINKDTIDFSNVADTVETDDVDLAADPVGEIWHPIKPAKYNNVRSLTMHFTDSGGGEQTLLHYVGFKGTSSGHKRGIVENAVYESQAQKKDHKVPGSETKAAEGFGM